MPLQTTVGFQAAPIASSPCTIRGGNGSCRRSVSARGTSLGGTSSSLSGLLSQADSRGLSGVDQLYKHFSLSGSQRRSVASSPTDGSGSGKAGLVATAPTQVVGFQVPGERASPFSTSSNIVPFPASKAPRPAAKGLLSRALTSETADQALPSLPETVAYFHDGLPQHLGVEPGPALFFPDVDTTLLRDLQERHGIFHTELVSTAFMLAAKAHQGQMRKDGTSMLSHSVLVSLNLAELGLDSECVAAGLLHEVLRLNPGFRSQMEEFMPSAVVQLVDRVTTISEISQLYRNNRSSMGDEKMRRMLLAMEDVKAVLIKLACRVHNMKTISALPREKQVSLAQETLDVFSVVANRLGVWCLKAELEDLAFSVLHPEEYEQLKKQVATRQDAEALEATITRIKAGLDARGVHYEDISGRPKNLYGIWCKMKASGITDIAQVYDLTALRVVVSNKHDCYAALRVLQETYRRMPNRSKDYIKEERKANGYQSLHETVYGEGDLPVEVQIRTHKMHYIAEYGFAAHWKYKEKLSDEDVWLDKEVQYKKWLTAYKLGVHDKKVRPNGAPPRETALKSLGMHLLDVGADGTAGCSMGSVDCGGVDPFLRHDRFRLQAPTKQNVSVMVQTQDSIDTRELPIGYSAAQLAQDLGVDALPGYALTVNQRLPSPDCVLRCGDLVQVVPLADALSRSPPESASTLLALQRQKVVVAPSTASPVGSALRVPLPGSSAPAPRAAVTVMGRAGSMPPPVPGSVRRRTSYSSGAVVRAQAQQQQQ